MAQRVYSGSKVRKGYGRRRKQLDEVDLGNIKVAQKAKAARSILQKRKAAAKKSSRVRHTEQVRIDDVSKLEAENQRLKNRVGELEQRLRKIHAISIGKMF